MQRQGPEFIPASVVANTLRVARPDRDVFLFLFHVAGWSGGYGNVEPPEPIPNSAVKIVSADGTAS